MDTHPIELERLEQMITQICLELSMSDPTGALRVERAVYAYRRAGLIVYGESDDDEEK